MIAVNASTSPHSSASFTPFGSDALTFAGEEKGAALFDADPTHSIASSRQIHRSHAALSQQGPIGRAFNLNRDKRRC